MLVSDAFPSKYLKASDLKGHQVTVTIARAQWEELGSDRKIVLYFEGKERGCVLNKTNANNIAMAYGDDTDDWIGAQVVLFSAMVDFQGRSVEAIRIKVPPRKPAPRPAAAPPPTITSGPQDRDDRPLDIDDSIPF